MKQELSELLFNAVNEQGYLFQEKCEEVLNTVNTMWEVIASEYPVSLQAEDTRIDMVLRAKSPPHPELYSIVECKRADPEYVYWLFGAQELCQGDALCSTLGIECNEPWSATAQPQNTISLPTQLHFGVTTYSPKWWLEVKEKNRTNEEKKKSTPQNIEKAFGQVIRDVGGFSLEQLEQRRKAHNTFKTFFIPVVITTASLYVARYKPKDVDLGTGKIAKGKINFGAQGQPLESEAVDWVLVDYGAGENVAQKLPSNYVGVDPAELQKSKIRSIFVVNSKSIQNFFSELSLVVES